jgi:hypothetical protein
MLLLEPLCDIMDDKPLPPPTEKRQKAIIKGVRDWLSVGRGEGETLELDDVTVHCFGREGALRHIYCSAGQMPFLISAAPLRESVREKAKKYRTLVQALKVPFVVSIVPQWESGRGVPELETAVLGDERLRLLMLPSGGHRPERYRTNGIFFRYPTLSAVSWAQWNGDGFAHTVLRNPCAAYPLADTVH